jgi:hypothetical protein
MVLPRHRFGREFPLRLPCSRRSPLVPSQASAEPGALDASFGGDGKVTTNLTSRYDYALGLIVQTDGKLVVAGPASGQGGRFALVRYAGDGSLDVRTAPKHCTVSKW